jgi:hypothetical protein
VAELLDGAKAQHEFNSEMKELGLGAGMEYSHRHAGGPFSMSTPGEAFIR